jgi:tetratricopeptide (TPR) repeat protein
VHRLIWVVAALAMLAVAALLIGWFGGEGADASRARAGAELTSGRLTEADAAFRRLERLGPLGSNDRLLGAQIAAAGGDAERALKLVAGVGAGDPLRPAADALAGRIELGRSRLRRAEEHLLRAVERDPSLIQPRRELILIYGYQSRFSELAEQFRSLSGRTPFVYRDLILWSHRDAMNWEGKEVIAYLGEAVEADPDDHWSRIALADALRMGNRLDEAAAVLAPVPASHPGAAAARLRLAQERGDRETVERILAEAPEDDPALAYTRGFMAANRGDFATAERAFLVAVRADPEDRQAIQGLVQATRQLGNPAESEKWARRLQALTTVHTLLGQTSASTEPPIPKLLEIAQALDAADRPAEARAWFSRVLVLDALNEAAQRGLLRLESAAP